MSTQRCLMLFWLCSLACACSGGAAVRRGDSPAPGAGGTEESSVAPEAASEAERMEEVRRLCGRKASSALSRCWNQEYERTGNRKLEAQVELMIVVAAGGTAEDVKVLVSQGSSKELDACVAEEARGWTYPEGKAATPVNCRFVLRSTM